METLVQNAPQLPFKALLYKISLFIRFGIRLKWFPYITPPDLYAVLYLIILWIIFISILLSNDIHPPLLPALFSIILFDVRFIDIFDRLDIHPPSPFIALFDIILLFDIRISILLSSIYIIPPCIPAVLLLNITDSMIIAFPDIKVWFT